ncbi:tetratricopeptide repeat protein [Luteimonas sp. BDR2-5]|uniref:type VI secretion system accessory protein TagJ n=1 Tax=Proluteimonas luteida TaxID=2878685 RepID=UPI001E5FD1C1|nr:type VI secretion system accessory protein TagJ [Luteimonas sp. BDR2-5]MCD9027856.1 tetratricopeptide repeat protein [Luteimonas sp. BDR2-5]
MTATVDAGAFRVATSPAERLLREGRPDEALQALTAQVRNAPADAQARVFLFQLLAAAGQWARARAQLDVATRLDPGNAMIAAAWAALLEAETVRADSIAGERVPTVVGEPADWLPPLLEALRLDGKGQHPAAAALRARAFDAAPATPGRIDGAPFAWIADADSRFGPCLELVLQGGYGWAPFERIRALRFDAPASLADTLWAPVQVTWRNGGQAHGYVPVRYPGSEALADPALRMGRTSDWSALDGATWIGHGQRMLATDAGEHALLDVRTIEFDGGD